MLESIWIKYLEQCNVYVTDENFPTFEKKWNEKIKTYKYYKGYITFAKTNIKSIYVTMQGYDKIVNTKDPNVQLFSIPIYCFCTQHVEWTKSSFKGLQTIITTIGIILHSQRNYHFIPFKCPKNCKMLSNHQIMLLN
jgi:hypothetical protein